MYFLEVFNAVLRRNTLAQTLHHATGGTGDAAEWIAGLGPTGDFSQAGPELSAIATGVLNFYESQHLYPILIYFRFGGARYAVARKTLIVFDVVTLIRTALDDRRYAAFIRSAPVTQLWNGSMQLMAMMSEIFLRREERQEADVGAATADRWRRRFRGEEPLALDPHPLRRGVVDIERHRVPGRAGAGVHDVWTRHDCGVCRCRSRLRGRDRRQGCARCEQERENYETSVPPG